MTISERDMLDHYRNLLLAKRRELDDALALIEKLPKIAGAPLPSPLNSGPSIGDKRPANRNVTALVRSYIENYQDEIIKIPDVVKFLRQGQEQVFVQQCPRHPKERDREEGY